MKPLLKAPDRCYRDNRTPASGVVATFIGPVRHPDCYAWFVFLSALDIMFTSIVLTLGGAEVNPLVHDVLARWGLGGLVAYKFSLVMFVVWVCEFIGRHRDATSRRLAEWSVAITVIPVFLAVAQLLVAAYGHAG